MAIIFILHVFIASANNYHEMVLPNEIINEYQIDYQINCINNKTQIIDISNISANIKSISIHGNCNFIISCKIDPVNRNYKKIDLYLYDKINIVYENHCDNIKFQEYLMYSENHHFEETVTENMSQLIEKKYVYTYNCSDFEILLINNSSAHIYCNKRFLNFNIINDYKFNMDSSNIYFKVAQLASPDSLDFIPKIIPSMKFKYPKYNLIFIDFFDLEIRLIEVLKDTELFQYNIVLDFFLEQIHRLFLFLSLG